MRASRMPSVAFLIGVLVLAALPGVAFSATQLEVAQVIRDSVMGGTLDSVTLWMTDMPWGTTYVAVGFDSTEVDTLPYAATWVVMIDSMPEANWGHPVVWVYVDDADLGRWTVVQGRVFPPSIFSDYGAGEPVAFSCVDLTSLGSWPCPDYTLPPSQSGMVGTDKDCLYAVLISGGWNSRSNYSRYPQNLSRMYKILRQCGYPKANIFVYYDNGGSLDLDNLDGDGSHATGSDVTGSVNEAAIRARIRNLCTTLNLLEDVLFIYTTNHGSSQGLCLWDFNGSGTAQANEVYTPAELGDDTKDCRVCDLFMILDQCYSGLFLNIAAPGTMDHWNTVIYTAASATEYSWGSEYLNVWDDNIPSTTTMNDMHQHVVATGLTFTPGVAIATNGMGNSSLCDCCATEDSQIVSERDSIHCKVDTANDLHITYWSDTPMEVSQHYDGQFPYFDVVYSTGPGWRFNYECTWSGYTVTYCNWVTVGAEFVQRSHNTLFKEDAYWTLDSVNVGNISLPGISVDPPLGAGPMDARIYNYSEAPVVITGLEIGYPGVVIPLSEMGYTPGGIGEMRADSIYIGSGGYWDTLLYPSGIPVSVMLQGYISSPTSEAYFGIQHEHLGGASCCGLYTGGYTGNTNCDIDGRRNLADISKLIDRVYISKAPLCCEENGNVNGDVEGRINLADISKLIDYVYISKEQTAACP